MSMITKTTGTVRCAVFRLANGQWAALPYVAPDVQYYGSTRAEALERLREAMTAESVSSANVVESDEVVLRLAVPAEEDR